MQWLQIKTSTGPYIFSANNIKSIVTTGNTGLRFVFEGSNIQPKPTDVWVDFTHTSGKGSEVADYFFEFVTREAGKKVKKRGVLAPITIADKVNNIYFSNEISACKIITPGSV
jgi:hypothetical protein